MLPAGTCGNILSYRESSQRRFFFYNSALNVSEKKTSADAGAYSGRRGALCHGYSVLTMPFSKKEQNEWCQAAEIY